MNPNFQNLNDIEMYYAFCLLFNKELMYNNQKESKITNRIEFNLTGEQIKKTITNRRINVNSRKLSEHCIKYR